MVITFFKIFFLYPLGGRGDHRMGIERCKQGLACTLVGRNPGHSAFSDC